MTSVEVSVRKCLRKQLSGGDAIGSVQRLEDAVHVVPFAPGGGPATLDYGRPLVAEVTNSARPARISRVAEVLDQRQHAAGRGFAIRQHLLELSELMLPLCQV